MGNTIQPAKTCCYTLVKRLLCEVFISPDRLSWSRQLCFGIASRDTKLKSFFEESFIVLTFEAAGYFSRLVCLGREGTLTRKVQRKFEFV